MTESFVTYEISGMGEAYENMCQRMLWRGVAHLEKVKPPIEMWKGAKSYPGVMGVLSTEGDELLALEEAMVPEGEDITGIMHQAVMQHLFYIHVNGLDAWRAALEEHRPEGSKIWSGVL